MLGLYAAKLGFKDHRCIRDTMYLLMNIHRHQLANECTLKTAGTFAGQS